jgi:UDP-N-acetylmuramoylalanine--D-glutamate ligase
MLNTDYFKNKRITIIGLARSGLACANLLFDLGARVSVTDNQDSALTRLNSGQLKSKDIRIELGQHSQKFITDSELVVLSPGVSLQSQAVVWAKEFKITLISEIEVAFKLCPATIIATTGTNGKTTVATLIAKTLESEGIPRVFVCGNIGRPFSGEVAKMNKEDFVSLEVSSFQLETIVEFRPKIAVILNLSRNHLDRYIDMQEYLSAKKRIFMNQGEDDYLVLNAEDPIIKGLAGESKAKSVFFKKNKTFNPNQAAVLSVASILGITLKSTVRVFEEFKGVEHRLESVEEINGVRFINDSKATTVDATVWALQNVSGKIILIAGGREKGNDYSLILDLARQKLKSAILIGEAKDKIKKAFKGSVALKDAASLPLAVEEAFLQAKSGDCVLFSPMCKSFDMFSDFEERGRVFKKAVGALKKSTG